MNALKHGLHSRPADKFRAFMRANGRLLTAINHAITQEQRSKRLKKATQNLTPTPVIRAKAFAPYPVIPARAFAPTPVIRAKAIAERRDLILVSSRFAQRMIESHKRVMIHV